MKSTLRRIVKLIVVWLITIVILVILFKKISFSDVLESLRQADISLFCVTVLVSVFTTMVLTVFRYRYILAVLGCPLTFKESLVLRVGSLPIKHVVPFKIGELSRVAYLKRIHRIPYARGLFSIVLDQAVGLVALGVLVCLGTILSAPVLMQKLGGALVLVVIVTLLFLAGSEPVFVRLKWLLRLLKLKGDELSAIQGALKPGTMGTILTYSLAFHVSELTVIYLTLRALGITVPPGIFLLFAPLTSLIGALPITFCGLGTRESAILFVFAAFGAAESLLAGSLLSTFVNRLFPIVLGLGFMKWFLDPLLNRAQAGGDGEEEQ